MKRTTHRAREESRLERIRHKRIQNFIFGYVTEKNRNEIIAKFKFHPKTGEEHFLATGIYNPNNDSITIQLYELQRKVVNSLQTTIWNGEGTSLEQMIEIFKSYLP